jgi:hypothetical protein
MTRDLSQATVHPEKVKTSSAVSRWSMDDADVDSGTIKDTWGSNDGTINNGGDSTVTSANGIGHTGQAFSFDGSNDYIQVPNDTSIQTQLPMTISAWVNLDKLPSNKGDDERITSKWPGANVGYLLQAEQNYDHFRLVVNDGSSNHEVNGSNYPPIQTNRWYHVTAVLKTDGKQQLYVNSQQIDQNDTTYSLGSPTNQDLYMGMYGTGGDKNLNGKIDEVRVYNTALTQQQVWKLYNIGRNANWGYSRS